MDNGNAKEFDNYVSLKGELNFVYKDIKLNRVIAGSIWAAANGKNSWKQWIRQAALFLRCYDLSSIVLDKWLFSTYGLYNRKDHQELYYNVITKLGDNVRSTNALHWSQKFVLHPFTIYKALRFFFSKSSLNFSSRIGLAAQATFYCNLIDELDKLDFSKVKKYLCMANMLNVENLITQYMKCKNIPTFSLSEGVYFVFKKKQPFDATQYENFETDHLLVYGQYSKDEFVGYGISPDRLVVAGYPKKVETKPMKKDNPYKKCMVLMCRHAYHHSNMALMSILSNYTSEYHICLKLHPGDDFDFYNKYVKEHNMDIIPKALTVNECLNNKDYDFAIAVNTTAYYEALMRGLPCLRFADGTFDIMHGYDDVFSDETSFESKLKSIAMLDSSEYQKEVDYTLRYAMGVGIDNYKAILVDNKI